MRPDLLTVLSERVVVADGAMGTMLQAAGGPDGLSLDDFEGYEGCNEVLNATRPDVVKAVHAEYFSVGVDAVETNTFGCNLANLGEYDIADRIYELSESGARHAREVADDFSTPDQPRYVIGSIGPGTKLPTLGHAPYAALRDAFQSEVAGLLDGGADALLVETAQDLLQAKAALIGANRAMRAAGRKIPLIAQVTIEQTGTMLLGSEIGAALTALSPLGIDLIGLNCATGPAEMTEHLRHLAEYSQIPISCMPNAGLPVLGKNGAEYPLSPKELADAHDRFTVEYGLSLVGGCCGTTPEHLRQVVERVRGREVVRRPSTFEASASSLYTSVPFRQEASVLMVGERTNTNGSKAFREALLDSNWNNVIEIARDAARDGAHMSDVCVDYVGRDGAVDMHEVAGRYATASTLPIMLDSTEPAVIEAGLERLGGRCLINSVNFEDGDGPDSRWSKVLPIITEHGAAVVALTIDEKGQARTAEDKVAIAERLIGDLTTKWGINEADIFVDTLTFTLGTGQEESRKDGEATINAIRELKRKHPDVQTILGLSNISFGLSPVSRVVLNSVFLHECQQAGLDAAIVHASKILPMSRIPDDQREVALDLIYDRRREGYDPLTAFLDLFAGVTSTADAKLSRAQELAALPLDERLQRRVIDGELNGLEADLDEALQERKALAIVNDTLLAGMKTVGELFGSGQMQLPFVLQSAQVMKTAVAHLEPHMEKLEDDEGKGTIVLATVKGDVHDIGKNLVDIIMSNNGYTVANIGIKQPVNAILDAAIEHKADVIGMSGLLVKSTVIMKENLVEMNTRGISTPVLLGGAALTRNYVEQDLAEIYTGRVRYARDAFEGLRLMDAVMAVKRGEQPEESLAPKARTRPRTERTEVPEPEAGGRSDVATDIVVPTAPFFGDRLVRGIQTKDYVSYLDERATLLGRWGLRASKGGAGPSYEELVETEGRPRIRAWLDRIQSEQMLEAAVVYGYYRCVSKGEDLIILGDEGQELTRFSFPRQRRDRRLCIADFFKAEDSGETDVIGFHMVTVGSKISGATAKLFEADAYRDYLELHGLSVQLAEALAEYWHSRIRGELGIGGDDNPDINEQIMHQAYRGSRYSFGYAACPDLEDRAKIAALLKPERIGVTLSEEFQLHPEQSTDAIVVHHPEAKYFAAR
ncbi:MAG: 5-methyltetrahydrofolate--homocysteine methyltransferase [Frankiaceae bacterium]|nr:5-methyltetrahydrofolate--homocysteine methyltransferase [Frankiaceae bacterium]